MVLVRCEWPCPRCVRVCVCVEQRAPFLLLLLFQQYVYTHMHTLITHNCFSSSIELCDDNGPDEDENIYTRHRLPRGSWFVVVATVELFRDIVDR